MNPHFRKFQSLMSSFLGQPKNPITDSGQMQFACPRCIAEKGQKEEHKHNLEVNIFKGFQCWSCCSMDDEMKGSISKLIKLYGDEVVLREYHQLILEMKNEPLYELNFKESLEPLIKKETQLPPNFRPIKDGKYIPKLVLEYLSKRGIDWDIINNFELGYTAYDSNHKQESSRIIIPSYNQYGELNYWTGRDYTSLPNRQKYFNPKTERKSLIFNEHKIQWDANITLVEGPFDHLVVPNSIPLLGKSLTHDYEIYQKLVERANANVNIFLDGDAFDSVVKIYKTLSIGKLKGRIRYIPVGKDYDPSELFAIGGRKTILDHLSNPQTISDFELEKYT